MTDKGFFITGTDTGVGKTIATRVLGALWRQKGIDVGVMKPVQCAGDDASQLVNALDIRDAFDLVNPYFAPEPLSPHIAFERDGQKILPSRILKAYQTLSQKHQLMLVEGAGGFLVPLTRKYWVADLARDLGLPVIIVARPGLGTINHTLLTVRAVQDYGLEVAGVIFCQQSQTKSGVAELTNPDVIGALGGVPILGTIPFFKKKDADKLVRRCCKSVSLPSLKDRAKINTAAWQDDDKRYVWHPFTQMQDWLKDDPLVITRARGSYLIDTDGKAYIDGVSSLWVNVHGHGHPLIDRAVKDQVNQLAHSTLLGLANTPSIALAKKLVEITPEGLDKVFYSDSGSTAVEIAVKLAYQYWQNQGQSRKTQILHMADSYHGDTLGSVSIGGIDLFHRVYRNLTFGAVRFMFPKGGLKAGLAAFEEFLQTNGERIAAFVTEPGIQGAAGMLVWPDGMLKGMADLCRKYQVLLIVDEVATGFGRTGSMFACEEQDVVPDFMCLAKGITGGYLPLAATMVSQKIYDGFLFDYQDMKTFFHGHTYTGNPLACAAALASFKIFEEQKVIKKLQSRIKHLRERLEKFYRLDWVGDIRQRGFMVGIELVRDRSTMEPFALEEKIGARVCLRVREKGVILRPLGNVVVVMPPLSISKVELDYLLDTVYWAIEAEIGGSFSK